MSNREQIVQIIDQLPDYKLSRLLVFLKGMAFDDELDAEMKAVCAEWRKSFA